MNYTLEHLIEEFGRHTSEYDRFTTEWNESNPTTPRDLQAFVLPRALLAIVSELKHLKDKYDPSQPQIPPSLPNEESQNPQSPV